MRYIELLAPAGSMESLVMAVQNGANAVYLGGTKFSARAYATNFTEKELEEAVDYCHSYDVRVNITLNTLLKDSELDEAVDYAAYLYEIGVDALIVQDPGLIYRLRKELPQFELHASTQMTVHNGEGALYYTEKGIQRIVLSRELSFEEIKEISVDLGIETEIFVHGALCISYSGQCLMSSILGGRSGNRGRCAQPCRLPYDLMDESGNSRAKAYLMSPKDITAIDNMDEILDSGVYSLKIEGRMKRPEYVAATVKYFREEIEGYSSEEHKKNLLKVFNREGLSDGYFHGKTGRDMMAFNYPKNTGIPIGQVTRDGSLILNAPLKKGDGLRVGEKGLTVEGIRDGKDLRETAQAGETVKLIGRSKLPEGKLYKTYDFDLMEDLRRSHNGLYDRKIPLEATLSFAPGEEASLTVTYKGRTYTRSSKIVEQAVKAPLSLERVADALKKSGEIPYIIDTITCIKFEEGFLPVKDLNEMRRLLLEDILSYEITSRKRVNRRIPLVTTALAKRNESLRLVGISTKEQLKAALETGMKELVLYPFYRGERHLSFKDVSDLLKKQEELDLKIYLKVSNILRKELHGVVKKVKDLKNHGHIEGVLTNNAGVIRALNDDFKIIGDYKLNLMNSYGLHLYGDDLYMSMVSEELNRQELKELKNKDRLITLVYGKQELMHSEYCPVGATLGGMTRETPCNEICMREKFALRDRMGEDFSVMTDVFCRSYIMNGKPKNLLDTTKDLTSLGFTSFRVDLTTESYEESLEILKAFKNEQGLTLESFNRGHYKRGVE